MHVLFSKHSSARARLQVAAASVAMLAACGGGSDNHGVLPVLFPGAPAAQPDSPPPTPVVTVQKSCGNLNGQTVAGASLTAVMIPATKTMAMHCRVSGTIPPALNIQIALPEVWNGKLYYQGGGGYNGTILPLQPQVLSQGYAMVASDSGHQANALSADFALTDTFAAQLFGSLSVPTVMSTTTEALTLAYGAQPTKSYFEGCSNGGREALMAVQRSPNLFDGVIARAPAYNWVGFMGAFNRNARALAAPGGTFTAAKTALLSKHVRDACDGLDGIVDGVVSNQAACTPALINVAALRCAGGTDSGDSCLSDAQLDVVTSWTTEATFTGSATFRNAGWNLTGNEDNPGAWRAWVTGDGNLAGAQQFLFQDTTVKNYLARDRSTNSLTYAPWDQNQNALYAMAALNDATNADIRPFLNSGGKLILWHGGSDSALSVKSTVEYYATLRASVGAAATEASTRFYVAPGVNHCSGGPGADSSDLLAALDQWVTRSAAPSTLLAEKRDTEGTVVFVRPLCQYPKYPRYTGLINDAAGPKSAASYICTS
ncbi:tannase/feruloyl esterase family alpha/beta hydrolase [Variovorax sp. RO1]|uniref:tannase/feruloyl esterase family alpha/beta hydrolase n=1 Tax=Variovorax sp. RO1 TaxID=2066034 RepID=UPI000C71810F|nr:tannase/feruloyl esterase family alpha/beta hydrolase [Variovorax sp. RO1]PLC02829.1 tannase/feruloyl esterase family alpha/beta hydrolase [Variovorax sp. RO1]